MRDTRGEALFGTVVIPATVTSRSPVQTDQGQHKDGLRMQAAACGVADKDPQQGKSFCLPALQGSALA